MRRFEVMVKVKDADLYGSAECVQFSSGQIALQFRTSNEVMIYDNIDQLIFLMGDEYPGFRIVWLDELTNEKSDE